MSVDQRLLDILVCPESHAPLLYFAEEDFLFCHETKRKYPVRENIPIMLIEESELATEEEAARLLALAEERGIVPLA